MNRFLVCDNSDCRFLLDLRIDGKSPCGAQFILTKCPACGGNWSSTSPSCGQPLAVKFADGLPRISCCEQKRQTDCKLPEHSATMAASL